MKIDKSWILKAAFVEKAIVATMLGRYCSKIWIYAQNAAIYLIILRLL